MAAVIDALAIRERWIELMPLSEHLRHPRLPKKVSKDAFGVAGAATYVTA